MSTPQMINMQQFQQQSAAPEEKETGFIGEDELTPIQQIIEKVSFPLNFVSVPCKPFASWRIINEYERIVVFRFGRSLGARGPGTVFINSFTEKGIVVDLRVKTVDVPPQEVITKDSVTVKVNAVIYYKVEDPTLAVTQCEDYKSSVFHLAQTYILRMMGTMDLETLLQNRQQAATELQKDLDRETDRWGIKVTNMEIKDIMLPPSMQRAMAARAEAERDGQAKMIAAEAEQKSAEILSQASKKLNDGAQNLRFLQTLVEVANTPNNTIVIPVPNKLMSKLGN